MAFVLSASIPSKRLHTHAQMFVVRRSGPEQRVVSAKDVVLAQVDVIRVNQGILIRKALENAQYLDP